MYSAPSWLYALTVRLCSVLDGECVGPVFPLLSPTQSDVNVPVELFYAIIYLRYLPAELKSGIYLLDWARMSIRYCYLAECSLFMFQGPSTATSAILDWRQFQNITLIYVSGCISVGARSWWLRSLPSDLLVVSFLTNPSLLGLLY